jgi:hypothetical protein
MLDAFPFIATFFSSHENEMKKKFYEFGLKRREDKVGKSAASAKIPIKIDLCVPAEPFT